MKQSHQPRGLTQPHPSFTQRNLSTGQSLEMSAFQCYTRGAMIDFREHITTTNDWPRPGIVTYDVAPLLSDPGIFRDLINGLAEPYRGLTIDAVVGLEARGFLIAGALARELNTGVVMIRKKGKLPPPTIREEYSYEYASQVIEMGEQALKKDQRVILVDDILATGGTMAAAVKLVNKFGVQIIGISFIIEMRYMAGRDRLKDQIIHSLVQYDS